MATKLLVDTDVLIEHLGARDPVAAKFEALVTTDVSIFYSPVSKAEIYAGMRKGEEAGRYLKQYQQSHGLDLGDAFQAACAFVFGVQLWTLNKKHYPMRDIEFFLG